MVNDGCKGNEPALIFREEKSSVRLGSVALHFVEKDMAELRIHVPAEILKGSIHNVWTCAYYLTGKWHGRCARVHRGSELFCDYTRPQ